jgi:metal-responsive CopG/Arc/MetJ family transcriptional regulator
MATHKTSIAVPEELLAAVDRVAEERGESRNRFVVRVLTEAVRARRDAEITNRLNELFAEHEARREQSAIAGQLESVANDWGSEDW